MDHGYIKDTSLDISQLGMVAVMMTQVHWKKLFLQTTMWLVAEVFLTYIGIDDLADYSEFHFVYRDDAISQLEVGTSFPKVMGPQG